MWSSTRLVFALSLCFVITSCSRGPGPVAAVAGRVTYNGRSLPSGVIVFVPDTTKGEAGPLAAGQILPDGTYSLKTGDNSGASAGWYRVTVTSLAPAVPQAGRSFNFPQSYIPDKYSDPNLSLLVCEVKANQSNTIDFNLK
jgi:hypothetical protein